MPVSVQLPSEASRNEPGYTLSAALIGILVALSVACMFFQPSSRFERSFATVLLGVYVVVWGFMFLASYFFSHKSLFLRGLIWFCEHLSFPSGRAMAFFYFAITLFIGGVAILRGLGLT